MSKQGNKPSIGRLITKGLGVLLITLTVVAVPIVLYFTVYIPSRGSYLANRDFRQLASVSVQLEDRITLLQDLFIKGVRRTLGDNENQTLEARFQQHLGNRKILEVVKAPLTNKTYSADEVKRITKNLESEVVMNTVTQGETSDICFIWPGSAEFPEGFEARAKLDEIVPRLMGKRTLESRKGTEHEQGFDSLLIAKLERSNTKDQQPTVRSTIIFQQGSSDLDVDSLDNLANANVPDKTIDVKILSENSTSAEVLLAGTGYKIYSQPIEMPVRTAGPVTANSQAANQGNGDERAETNWVVCGLVQDSHFRHEAWTFPYTWLILFVFASAVIILSVPFVKLQFLGPKDRLKLADFYWIGFSLLIGGAMLTLFLLYGVSYLRNEALLDQQLQQISSDINARFQDEVASVLKEAAALKAQGQADLNSTDKNHGLTRSGILRDDKHKGYIEYADYPYFMRAMWVDREGRTRLEWTTDPGPTLLTITDRDYFKRLIEGRTRNNKAYDPPRFLGDNQDRFWLEPVTSRLTTERAVVLSSSISNKGNDDGPEMLLLGDVGLTSLMRTIVPAGFGYRVVDNSGNDPSDDQPNDPGKVLFQSSESQQTKENFFEECDNNHSLRSLVYGRATDFADVSYKGDSHRLFIRPLDGFPNWSLVVFRNKQPLRTVYVQILTLAGFIFFCYSLVLLLPLTLAYLIRVRNHRTEWIWPSTQKADVYRQTHYVYLLLCAISLAITFGLPRFLGVDADRWTPIALASLVAFTGVLILAFRPKLTRQLNKFEAIVNKLRLNKLLDRGNIYVWNIVVLLVLLGILPALNFYKVAYNEEMKLFAKRAQLTLADGLEGRQRRVNAQYSTERVDAASNPSPFGDQSEAEQFIFRRLWERRDIYTDFWTQLTPSGENADQSMRPDPGLDGVMKSFIMAVPSFNETSVEMGGLTQGKAADDNWDWRIPIDTNNLLGRELPANDNLVLYLPGRTTAFVSTQLQRFGPTWRVALLWLTAGFLVIVLLLFLVVRFVVRKVFLLDLTENLYLPTSATDEIKQNVFLVQSSPLVISNGGSNGDAKPAPYHYVDLPIKASQEEWVRKLEAEIKAAPENAVLLDHFEFRMHDRNHNDQKLKLIKNVMASEKRLLIKSSHLPSAFSFTGAVRDTVKGRPNQSTDSWAEIMTHFRRSYESRSNEQVLCDAIKRLRETLESNPAMADRKDAALSLANSVKHECSGSNWLANIGKELIESLGTEDLDSNYIVGQLSDRAELYYLKLWNDCSNDEKLTLLHLAKDRLLSYRDGDIEPLMQRGLIVCAPDLRLMNETFKAFVLRQCLLDVHESAKLQFAETQAKSASGLNNIQIPAVVGFIGLITFLALTQTNLFSSPLTVLTAATSALPTLFKVLSLFQGESTGRKVFNA